MTFVLDIINIVGTLASLVAALFAFLVWRSERNQELSILNALNLHIDFILDSAKGHYKQMNAVHLRKPNASLPAWAIPNIDLNFYLAKLQNEIRAENCILVRIKTRKLKKYMISFYEKINTINFLWNKHLDSGEFASDIFTSTYYDDLMRFGLLSKIEIAKMLSK